MAENNLHKRSARGKRRARLNDLKKKYPHLDFEDMKKDALQFAEKYLSLQKQILQDESTRTKTSLPEPPQTEDGGEEPQ